MKLTGIHIKEPLGADGDAPFTTESDQLRSVIANIKAILLVAPRQRINRQGIGTPLEQLIYNPADQATTLATRAIVLGQLQRFEPRVEFIQVSVSLGDVIDENEEGSVIVSIVVRGTLKSTRAPVNLAFRVQLDGGTA